MALTVGVLYLAGLGVQGLGLILHIVGLATPEWSTIEYRSVEESTGLWERCSQGSCVDIPDIAKSSGLEASEAFAIIGMLVGAAALVIGLLYIIFPAIGKTADANIPVASCGVAIFALICVLICIIVYAADVHEDFKKAGKILGVSPELGYSFGLSITGGILMAIGGVLVFLGKSQTVG